MFMESKGKTRLIRISVWVAVLSLLFTVLSSLATALGASAHAALKSVTPGDGTTVAEAPAEVVLTFNEAISTSFAAVTVTDGQGAPVTRGRSGRRRPHGDPGPGARRQRDLHRVLPSGQRGRPCGLQPQHVPRAPRRRHDAGKRDRGHPDVVRVRNFPGRHLVTVHHPGLGTGCRGPATALPWGLAAVAAIAAAAAAVALGRGWSRRE